MGALRSHASHIVVGITASIVTAVAPAAATAVVDAVDAHTVDGFHAVPAGAANKATRLVATNSNSRLPASIIPKVGDSHRLDGLGSEAFERVRNRTIVVRATTDFGASGQRLRDAVNRAINGGTTNAMPWLIELEPGTYDIGSGPLTLPGNIDMLGAGLDRTVIVGNGDPGAGGDSEKFGTLHITGAGTTAGRTTTHLSDLTVRSVGTNSAGSAVAVTVRNAARVRVWDARLEALGGNYTYGLHALGAPGARASVYFNDVRANTNRTSTAEVYPFNTAGAFTSYADLWAEASEFTALARQYAHGIQTGDSVVNIFDSTVTGTLSSNAGAAWGVKNDAGQVLLFTSDVEARGSNPDATTIVGVESLYFSGGDSPTVDIMHSSVDGWDAAVSANSTGSVDVAYSTVGDVLAGTASYRCAFNLDFGFNPVTNCTFPNDPF